MSDLHSIPLDEHMWSPGGFASHIPVLYREVPFILNIKKAVPGSGTALKQFSVEALELQECIRSCRSLDYSSIPTSNAA